MQAEFLILGMSPPAFDFGNGVIRAVLFLPPSESLKFNW
jgi:hypothetical protein